MTHLVVHFNHSSLYFTLNNSNNNINNNNRKNQKLRSKEKGKSSKLAYQPTNKLT